jgi:tRNA 2-thiouridine synthesizing protein B
MKMSMLHTVNKSPFDKNTLAACLRTSKDGSSILLIEDGIYAAMTGTAISDQIKEAMKTKKVYALKPDVDARGVQDKVMEGVEQIDYTGFVNLVVEHNSVQSWL